MRTNTALANDNHLHITRIPWTESELEKLPVLVAEGGYGLAASKLKRPYSSVVNKCISEGITEARKHIKQGIKKKVSYLKIPLDGKELDDTLKIILMLQSKGYKPEIA